MAAVGVYVLAMALHAAEYAALRRHSRRSAGGGVAVGATSAAPTVPDERPVGPDLSDERPLGRAPAPTGSAGRR